VGPPNLPLNNILPINLGNISKIKCEDVPSIIQNIIPSLDVLKKSMTEYSRLSETSLTRLETAASVRDWKVVSEEANNLRNYDEMTAKLKLSITGYKK